MSSDLLENCIDNHKAEVFLTMKASGYATLGVYDEMAYDTSTFELTPNDEGIKNAKLIENALAAWRNHIEETGLIK